MPKALDQQFERALGHADQAHAMMDAARPQAALGDLEAAALAEQQVFGRHPDVVEADLPVALGGVVEAHHRQITLDRDPGRVRLDQDHRLLLVLVGVRVGLAHHDPDAAAPVAGARGPPLGSVDDVLVAVAGDRGLDVGGVGRGDVGLGHAEGRADLAVEQGLEPLLLVRVGAVAGEHLHVAGVGRRAVARLGREQGRAAHDLAQVGIFEVGQAGAELALGQEQVPQAAPARLGLQFLHQRRRVPAVAPGDLFVVGLLAGVDVLVHEREQRFLELDDPGRRFVQHRLGPWQRGGGRADPHGTTVGTGGQLMRVKVPRHGRASRDLLGMRTIHCRSPYPHPE
jgi:hypothetical protein